MAKVPPGMAIIRVSRNVDADMRHIALDRPVRGGVVGHGHAEIAADVERLAAARRHQHAGRQADPRQFLAAGAQHHFRGPAEALATAKRMRQLARALRQGLAGRDMRHLLRIGRAGTK